MSGNKKQEKISKVTLDYLRKRPNSGDTLEGITKWWLERGWTEIATEDAAEVLENLLKKGKVRTYTNKDGTTFYKIAEEKEPGIIDQFLEPWIRGRFGRKFGLIILVLIGMLLLLSLLSWILELF